MELRSNVITKKTAMEIQLKTLQHISDTLKNSFGPYGSTTGMIKGLDSNSNNVIIEYTKDGDTIANAIHYINPIEKAVKDLVTSITHHVVKYVGDGTTSVVIITNLIMKLLYEKHTDGDPIKLMKDFDAVVTKMQEIITTCGREATLEDLYDIMMISTNGNEDISMSLYQVYKKFGLDLYIDVSTSGQAEHIIKEYDGMTLDTGKATPVMPNEVQNPRIYYFEDPIDTPQMAQFVGKIINDNIMLAYTKNSRRNPIPTVILCKAISRDTERFFKDVESLQSQVPNVPLIIVTNIHQEYMMDDIVEMCGINPIKKFIDPNMENQELEAGRAPTLETIIDFYGTADAVVSDDFKTKIIRPACMFNEDGSFSDTYNKQVSWLESHIKLAEEQNLGIKEIEQTKRRLNSFKGNMIDFLVGGTSSSDVQATKASVEDAVLNCRSAAIDGVGYGANFMAYKAIRDIKSNKTMEDNPFVDIIYEAYTELLKELYHVNDTKLLDEMYEKNVPYNIRTEKFDGKVLSSIKSDIVILDAIRRILMLMYTSNQYMVPNAMQNIYREDV